MGMQDTLRALADPTRREILNLLKKSRLSAGEIGDHFSISGAAVSRHLSVLKEADLIRDEREGKFIYYELNTTVLEEIMLWITELKGGQAFLPECRLQPYTRCCQPVRACLSAPCDRNRISAPGISCQTGLPRNPVWLPQRDATVCPADSTWSRHPFSICCMPQNPSLYNLLK